MAGQDSRGARRSLADAIIGALPYRAALVRAGARLPPALRSQLSYRLFAAVARRTSLNGAIAEANFGISARLRCRVRPGDSMALFGKPRLYRGERASLELAAHFAKSSDAFLDIGAHLGYFTFFVREHVRPAVPVHFFEPDPELYAMLDRNVRTNALQRVFGHNEAIGACDGTAMFFINRSDSYSGSLTTQFSAGHDIVPAPVAVRSFASVARDAGLECACVKVDVEGAEREFLDGAAEVLDRVAYLIMEVLGPANASGFVADIMRKGRFHAYYINDYVLEHSEDGSFAYQPGEYNWLFCRRAPADLRAALDGTRFEIRS